MRDRFYNRWEDPNNPGHPKPGYRKKFYAIQASIEKRRQKEETWTLSKK